MAAPKRATHRVVKAGLYFTAGVNGQLAETEVGTEMTLTDEQAVGLVARGFVVSLRDAKKIDVSKDAEEPTED